MFISVAGQLNRPDGIAANDYSVDPDKSSASSTSHAIESADVEPESEKLFENWQQPNFAIFVSGRQHGYIEPCGCTGLENQKGGLMRRHQLMKRLRQKGWELLAIDAGNQIKRFGAQPSLKLGKTYEALCQIMGYQVVGIGPDDLKLSAIDLLQNMMNYQGATNPFTCANVVINSQEFTSPYRIVEVGGARVAVTYVLGDEHLDSVRDDDIRVSPTHDALRRVWPHIEAERCDLHVLVAFTSLKNSRKLARQFPYFDVFVTAGGLGEPTKSPEPIQVGDHTTQMVQVGTKGMYVGVVGRFNDGSIRYQRVPLDNRFEDSEEMKELFISYQRQLQDLGLDGLSIRTIGHPSGRQYAGTDICYDCHDVEWEIWRHGVELDPEQNGPHWRATLDLVEPSERVFVKRHHDPECLSCHVTGWNPQHYYPYTSGYHELSDRELHGNGCENCHGPAGAHVQAETGSIEISDDQLKALREELHVTLEEARESLCVDCHDLDNSPDFHEPGAFEEYWAKIEH